MTTSLAISTLSTFRREKNAPGDALAFPAPPGTVPNDYDAVREERLAHGLDDGLDIPAFLKRGLPKSVPPDRRPALGPPGDSLDDLV